MTTTTTTKSNNSFDLLRPPSNTEYPELLRATSSYVPHDDYVLAKGDLKHYQQQYGDIYFLRLAQLKPIVEEIASEAWQGYQIAGDTVHRVERVLDVRQGELCWVVGTIYMDMPLKPNILDDISKDNWIAAPPPREKYLSPNGQDKVMLEDESGRLRLTGPSLMAETLVTGCIVAVMGTENADGDFEVIDIKVPDLPRQPPPARHSQDTPGAKVAIVSGLSITGESGNTLPLDLFMEWIIGESGSPAEQAKAASVARLVIAGNSISDATPLADRDDPNPLPSSTMKKPSHAAAKKYGYDASSYNPAPTTQLDMLLNTLLPSIPITLLPGASDPANVSLPQQPLHTALLPLSRAFAAAPIQTNTTTSGTNKKASTAAANVNAEYPFHPTTNPCTFTLGPSLFLGHSGQPILDISKYVPSTALPQSQLSSSSDTDSPATAAECLALMQHTLRWRVVAPTCPDTLWCYPYQSADPFVIAEDMCPGVYFSGNMDGFAAGWVEGQAGEKVRCICVPRFSERGEVVLMDLETKEVEVVRFGVWEG